MKIEELPKFDVTGGIKTVDDIKDWMGVSIQEDDGILDIEYTLKLLMKAIDRIKNEHDSIKQSAPDSATHYDDGGDYYMVEESSVVEIWTGEKWRTPIFD